ncbi:MAG TPA: zinc ribbon domain-containing protein [Thermoplasmata archaeon]
MTSQEALAYLWTKFRKFRGTRWFRVVYVAILIALVAQLYVLTASALACLILFLMPFSVFLIPYYFGERRMRHFALNALPIFVIATLLAGAMQTQALLAQSDPVELSSASVPSSAPTMALENGTVSPYHADPGRDFTFRVRLITTVDGNYSTYNVSLNLTVIEGVSGSQPSFPMAYSPGPNSSTNTRDGTWYVATLPLGGSIYGYAFSVTDNAGNWTYTSSDFGPITASGTAFYGFFTYYTGLSMTFPALFYFVILFMWWYTRRMRDNRTRMLGTEIPKEKPVPEPGNKAVEKPTEAGGKASKAAAFTCTNCGADVGEDDEKCPKCGAVFED